MSELGDSYAFNAHGDVLNATPNDPEEKARLVDELKTRGNAAFKARQLPVADTLYSKALEHDPSSHAIYGNRSMTRLSMGKFEEALEDADAAIKANESWAKGHFRRAKALGALDRYDEALAAIKRAVELDPKDKTLAKEETDFATKAERAAAEAAAKPKEPEPPKPAAPKPAAAKSTAPKPAASKPAAVKSEEAGAEGEDEENFRGYKILPDGRKTSFFHHEMSEQEKALLGDMTPKQLSAEEAAALAKAQADNQGASSVWAGNTWEDRKMNDWAETKLKELVAPCTVTSGEDTIAVQEIESFQGTASIYVKLGKKKHFFDLSFKVKWAIESLDARGTLEYADVVKDDVDDADVVANLKHTGSAGGTDAVRKLTKALEAEILRALTEFSAEFLQV